MKAIFTKKFIQIIFVLSLTIFMTACDKVKISFYTEIFENGSAFRTVQYAYTPSNEAQLKFINSKLPDILQKGFVLPKVPDWTIKEKIEDKTFYFIAEKKFNSINELKSDYYKLSNFFGASQNFVSFDISKGANSTEYDFLEVYKDSANIKGFSESFLTYLIANKISLTKALYKITKDEIPEFKMGNAEDIVELFIDKTGEFNNSLKTIEIVGPRERKVIINELSSLNKDIEIDEFIDYLNGEDDKALNSGLTKMFKLNRSNTTIKARKNLLENLETLVKDSFSEVAKADKVDPLGAYYTSLDTLNLYKFEYILKMPGVITNSNGNRLDDNTIQWIFTPEDFFNHDYAIIAKSSLVK